MGALGRVKVSQFDTQTGTAADRDRQTDRGSGKERGRCRGKGS